MAPDQPWHTALAYALVGERLDLPPREVPDAEALLTELTAAGWDPARIAAAGRTHQVPTDLLDGLGPAQFWAALAEVRRRLGSAGGPRHSPSSRRELTAEERRLLADRPPHWG